MPENLAVLDPGEFFGEMALVENKLRSATATAVGQSEVYALEQTALDGFFAEHPDIHLTIVQNLVHITSSRLRFSDETLVQSAYDCIIEIDASFHVLNHSRITTRPGLIDHTTDDAPTSLDISCSKSFPGPVRVSGSSWLASASWVAG